MSIFTIFSYLGHFRISQSQYIYIYTVKQMHNKNKNGKAIVIVVVVIADSIQSDDSIQVDASIQFGTRRTLARAALCVVQMFAKLNRIESSN